MRNVYPITGSEWFVFSQSKRTGVPLFYRAVPVDLIAGKCYFSLAGLHLSLLNTKNISIHLCEKVSKAFSKTSPEAVYIPGD
jgi:hypothetical protein